MSLQYYNQAVTETLARKAPGVTPAGFPSRQSDLSFVLFGKFNRNAGELVYLRNQNASPQGVDEKDSDAWTKFAGAQGVVASRSDQMQREFFIEKNLP